ncbi:MAG: hypothetical protein ACRDT9_16895, partial [Agromyces sp.]
MLLPALDTDSLTRPISKADLAAQRRRDLAAGRAKRWPAIALAVFLCMIGVGCLAMAVFGFVAAFGWGWFAALPMVATCAVLAAITVGVVAVWRLVIGMPAKAEARLHRFAALNGLEYEPNAAPRLPGHLFEELRGKPRNSRFSTRSGRAVEIGDLLFVQPRAGTSVSVSIGPGGSARASADRRSYWRYVAVQLDGPLPHIVLEPQGRTTDGRAFPVDFDAVQHRSLEGDFDRHFHVFVPKQYERDALYVFTPDLMAAMIDEAPGMHIEIVDDWVIFSRNGRADFAAPSTWAAIERIANHAASGIVERGGRYHDERTPGETPTAGRETVLRTVA